MRKWILLSLYGIGVVTTAVGVGLIYDNIGNAIVVVGAGFLLLSSVGSINGEW